MPRLLLSFAVALHVALMACATATAEDVSFEGQIAPILIERCLTCHNDKTAEGGYRLDTFARLIKAGDSEQAAITSGKPNESELLRRIASDEESERMPAESDPLPAEEIALIRQWIQDGARCDDTHREQPLAAIVPAPSYPAAPDSYPQPIPIAALAFSPDGSQLLVGGYHEVTVWSIDDGKLVDRIGNVGQRVYGIDIDAAGNRIAIACGQPGRSGEARVIDWQSHSVLRSFARTTDVTFAARFDPAGDRLAIAAADAVVSIVDVEAGTTLQAITSHSDWVTTLAWSADGKQLATASRDKTAKVFDAATGESLITFSGHKAHVRGVAFHKDGKQVYSVAGDRRLRRWKIADGKQEKELKIEGEPFDMRASGELLLVPTSGRLVYAFAADSGDVRREFQGHADWVLSVASHAATGRVAGGGIDGTVRVWEAETGKEIINFLAVP